jgi:O-antigen ligase
MRDAAALFWRIAPKTDAEASIRWMFGVALGLALFPVFGSSVSFGVVGGALIAWIFLAIDRARFLPLQKQEKQIALIATAYFLITLISGAIAQHPLDGLAAAGSHLGFIVVLPLLPVLRYHRDDYWERWFRVALVVGGVLAAFSAVVDAWYSRSFRAEALTGNALIFAYLAGMTACANGWLMLTSRQRWKIVHGVGTLGALLALVLSGSRWPLLAFALVAAIGLAWSVRAQPRHWRDAAMLAYATITAVSVLYVALLFFDATQSVVDRLAARLMNLPELASELLEEAPVTNSALDSALGVRRTMLAAGWQAFLAEPLFGYGRQNVMAAVQGFAEGTPLPFTHLHNACLTEAVAAGIPGLVSFLAILALPIVATRNADPPWRGLAVILTSYTALYSLTNIGFSHDIKVFSYCLFVVALNALGRERTTISPSQSLRYADYVQSEIT